MPLAASQQDGQHLKVLDSRQEQSRRRSASPTSSSKMRCMVHAGPWQSTCRTSRNRCPAAGRGTGEISTVKVCTIDRPCPAQLHRLRSRGAARPWHPRHIFDHAVSPAESGMCTGGALYADWKCPYQVAGHAPTHPGAGCFDLQSLSRSLLSGIASVHQPCTERLVNLAPEVPWQ